MKEAQQAAAEKEEADEPKEKKEDDETTQNLAQAEVEAMLDVEKRQQAAVEKAQGLVKPEAKQGFDRDLHIDKSIIDKVKKESDKEIEQVEDDSRKKAV